MGTTISFFIVQTKSGRRPRAGKDPDQFGVTGELIHFSLIDLKKNYIQFVYLADS